MRQLSSMLLKIITLLFLLSSSISEGKTWIKSAYWLTDSSISIHDIDSSLFTHLIFAFAPTNSTYQAYIARKDEPKCSTFTNTVKERNPSITTLLAIWPGEGTNFSNFFAMLGQASRRNSFVESSIKAARLYGFQGILLSGVGIWPGMGTNLTGLGTLLEEWRAAINSESKNHPTESRLILAMGAHYSPTADLIVGYPVKSMEKNLDWIHILAFDYHYPLIDNFTGAPAALYDPSSKVSTDYGVNQWIAGGFPARKMVLGLACHGYAWELVNPRENRIGSPAIGHAGISSNGQMIYKSIKDNMRSYGAALQYNATYVVNYWTMGLVWVGYDDVEAIRTKVSYAKRNEFLGYTIWHLDRDDNWVLSKAAQEGDKKQGKKKLYLEITLPTIVVLTVLLSTLLWRVRRMKVKRILTTAKKLESPSLQVFSFVDIKAFTSNFSRENKLGEGGYGPVYKGKLPDGQEIAVKRLSKTSKQGVEEFKNEVSLTAKLQHVNLVRLLGFCTEREEKLLVYEFMPNKSLDYYLYDPARRQLLKWKKWLQIIEGVTQGLLYLQEYSRFTIIHRDLKASNILLDNEMKPKITDFGLAKIFQKDEHEANTSHIVGTYGYVPPEYVKDGLYSTKYDVYSFGVLLLQIISGKKNTCLCGPQQNRNLLEYAYELWKDGKGIEFIDPLLDDASSSCKIIRCLQVALLCVQENWQDRPSMLEIFSMLKNETDVVPTPKRAAFSTNKDEEQENTFTPRPEISLDSVVTISELEP